MNSGCKILLQLSVKKRERGGGLIGELPENKKMNEHVNVDRHLIDFHVYLNGHI